MPVEYSRGCPLEKKVCIHQDRLKTKAICRLLRVTTCYVRNIHILATTYSLFYVPQRSVKFLCRFFFNVLREYVVIFPHNLKP
jgi:hypothetical protein